MEIIENPNVGKFHLPLPIYTNVTLATALANDGEKFDIVAGLGKSSSEEIKKHALDEGDEELQKNTHDHKRFGEGSYEEWYAKDRTPFGLIHKKTETLAALFYIGPKTLGHEPGEWHTIGYRSYNPFRGKGLMKDFSKFAMEIYSGSHPGVHYWVRINPENKASIALSSSLGLVISEKYSDPASGSLIFVK